MQQSSSHRAAIAVSGRSNPGPLPPRPTPAAAETPPSVDSVGRRARPSSTAARWWDSGAFVRGEMWVVNRVVTRVANRARRGSDQAVIKWCAQGVIRSHQVVIRSHQVVIRSHQVPSCSLKPRQMANQLPNARTNSSARRVWRALLLCTVQEHAQWAGLDSRDLMTKLCQALYLVSTTCRIQYEGEPTSNSRVKLSCI